MNRNPNAPSIGRRGSLAGLLLLLALSILLCLLFSHPVDTGGEARQTALLIAANGLRQGQSREDVRLFPGPEGTGVQVAHTINGADYVTAYYLYQGSFCQHLYRSDRGFDPALGSALCPAADFSAGLDGGMLTLSLAGPVGEGAQLSLFFPAGREADHG